MPKLITDFFTVAQSGPTVDGRIIKPEWLVDMADTYNAKKYTGKIWPEHIRWRALGEIAEVRSVNQSDGTVTLENRIVPYNDLMYYVRSGSLTHPSVEVIEDFAKSGKAYQFGMGATDSPASLGTDNFPIHFSTQQPPEQLDQYALFCQRIALDAHVPVEQVHIFSSPIQWGDLEFKKQQTFFDLGRFFRSSSPPPTEQPPEDIDMTKEELQEVLQGFKTELKTELKQEFSAPPSPPPVVAGVDPAAGEDKTAEVTITVDQFNTLKKAHDELKADYEKFKSEDVSINRPPAAGGDGNDVWNWGKE